MGTLELGGSTILVVHFLELQFRSFKSGHGPLLRERNHLISQRLDFLIVLKEDPPRKDTERSGEHKFRLLQTLIYARARATLSVVVL